MYTGLPLVIVPVYWPIIGHLDEVIFYRHYKHFNDRKVLNNRVAALPTLKRPSTNTYIYCREALLKKQGWQHP